METNLADYLTIDPNALSIIHATTDIYMGPFHKIHPKKASLLDVDDAATATDSSDSFLLSFPSVSDVLNESRQQTGVSVANDQRQAFDAAWREQLHQLFQASGPEVHHELLDYQRTGLSNGYALGLQVMVLSPGQCFKIHAHPNIEFEYTLLGTLREFRCCHFTADAKDLAAKPASLDASDDDASPEPSLLEGPEIDTSFMFEERSCPQNHCMLNETGSIHQSFTAPDQACAILVLWSQCHANSHPSRVFTTDPRLRPSAGW
jgi:hypothetical protein